MTIELRCLTCEKSGIYNPFKTGLDDQSVIDLSHLLGTKDSYLDLSDLPNGRPNFAKLQAEEKKYAEIIVNHHVASWHLVPAARQKVAERLAKKQGKTVEQILQEAFDKRMPLLPGEWALRSEMLRPEVKVSEWRMPLMIPTAYLSLVE